MAGTLDPIHQRIWKEGKTWKLECSPIRKYVEAANLKRVDFFSVDVEGAEYEVLATYPFDSVPVYAILIELIFFLPEEREKRTNNVVNCYESKALFTWKSLVMEISMKFGSTQTIRDLNCKK